MNKFSLKAGLGIAFTAAFFATSANAVVQSNNAAVTIVAPLVVTANDDMDFGKVARPVSGSGTVVLDTAGSRTVGGDATLVPSSSSAGTVGIDGTSGESVTITVTDTTTGAANTGLSLSDFTSSTLGGQSLAAGTLTTNLPADSNTLTIGATLNVDDTATAGAKTLTYDVEAVYN